MNDEHDINGDLLVPEAVDNETVDQEDTVDSATIEADDTVENENDIETEDEVEDVDHDGDGDDNPEAEDDTEEVVEDVSANKGRKTGVERKIGKLTAQKYEAQREAEYWRKLAQDKELAPAPAQPQAAVVNDEKPSLSQFDYDQEAYTEALADWKLDTKLAERDKQAAVRITQDTYAARVNAFAKENPDYLDAIDDVKHIGLSQSVAEGVVESELAPQIEYYLATNPDELVRINSLSRNRSLVELGKIESKLTVKPVKQKAVNTKAPKPISPVKGIKAPSNKNEDDMSFAEYEKWADEQWRLKNK